MSRTITVSDVRIILTQPSHSRLAVVKIETSEPGLTGVGCATFTQRVHAVAAALERHLKPFLLGRDVSRIEEIWQMLMVNGYWRNGPVLNNAISGIDQALWDIKGKMAGMPVFDLLGGKSREAANVYVHADGGSPDDVAAQAATFVESGYRYIRVQQGLYGGSADSFTPPRGALPGAYFDPQRYQHDTIEMIAHVRDRLGPSIELIHDVHERLAPADAVRFAKDVEPYRLFFLEDVLAPEDLHWLSRVRSQSTTPLALGELFNHPLEWRTVIEQRLVDFIRMHVSQMGGITPARKAADFAHAYGIRTAWHGPGDTSPVGHAANLHLDIWSPAFGIQEWYRPSDIEYEMFPGLPQVDDGYLYPNDQPGLGIDINEEMAADYPVAEIVEEWTQARLP
ncbi:MAG: enolase C-terminal domain-like protein, partial [Ilumatobacteraceae bacterium]